MDISLKVLDAYLLQKGLLSASALQEPLTLPPMAESIPDSLLAFEGYYAGDGGSIIKLKLDSANNGLAIFSTDPARAEPALSAIYNGGLFHDQSGKKYYLGNVADNRYLVSSTNLAEIILFQKIEPLTTPQHLGINIDGSRWLRRNVSPYEARMSVPGHIASARLLPELPGYLDFGGIKKITSPTTAGVSLASVRDANELILFTEQNQTWAWISGLLFTQAELAVPLQTGNNTITINRSGINEWHKVSQNSILQVSGPMHSRIIIFSPTDSILYDSAVDQGEVVAPAGSFVEVAASVGESVQIIAR